jgi:hypothetical protein
VTERPDWRDRATNLGDTVTAPHPKLVAAHAALDKRDDFRPMVALAFGAIAAQDDGRYCECSEPLLAGDDLMCGACLLNNKDQERKRCARSCNAHEFVPSPKFPPMCAVCTMWKDSPRHHGVDATPRYSWETP